MLPDGTIPWTGNRGYRPNRVSSTASRAPRMEGGIVEVCGELQITPGFERGIQAVTVSINANNLSPDEESKVSWYQLNPSTEPNKFIIRVEKGGANEGILGDNPVQVSWIAWEK